MTTSAMTTPPEHAASRPRALRMLLVGLAIVVLLAAAFAVGHLTGTSRQGTTTSPVGIQAPASAGIAVTSYCPAGQLRGPC